MSEPLQLSLKTMEHLAILASQRQTTPKRIIEEALEALFSGQAAILDLSGLLPGQTVQLAIKSVSGLAGRQPIWRRAIQAFFGRNSKQSCQPTMSAVSGGPDDKEKR